MIRLNWPVFVMKWKSMFWKACSCLKKKIKVFLGNLNKSFSKKIMVFTAQTTAYSERDWLPRQLQTAKSVAGCQVGCRLTRQLQTVTMTDMPDSQDNCRQLQTIRTTLDSREKLVLIWLVTPLKCGTRIISCILGQGHCKTVNSDYLTLYTPEVHLVYHF